LLLIAAVAQLHRLRCVASACLGDYEAALGEAVQLLHWWSMQLFKSRASLQRSSTTTPNAAAAAAAVAAAALLAGGGAKSSLGDPCPASICTSHTVSASAPSHCSLSFQGKGVNTRLLLLLLSSQAEQERTPLSG
jgi:hypothetical protein